MFATVSSLSLPDYGILGVILAISFSAIGWLTRSYVKRSELREEKLEKQNDELNRLLLSILTDKAIPALVESSQVVKESTDLGRKLMEHLTETHDLLQRLLEAERRK